MLSDLADEGAPWLQREAAAAETPAAGAVFKGRDGGLRRQGVRGALAAEIEDAAVLWREKRFAVN